MGFIQQQYGEFEGQKVYQYQLTNKQGMGFNILNLGGIITHITTPDKNGKISNIVLGYDDLAGYLHDPFYMGVLVGRFANRIANARFDLDGQSYALTANQAPHHLHGGQYGFHRRIWQVIHRTEQNAEVLEFTRTSPDGEEGYPGSLNTKVIYRLTDDNCLQVEMTAVCNKACPVSFTLHPYFNLADEGVIGEHQLRLNTYAVVATDADGIPTGEIIPSQDTAFDFCRKKSIQKGLNQQHPLQMEAHGFDHNLVVDDECADLSVPIASVYEPKTGRKMELYSNQPGVQFYSGNYLTGRFEPYSGFCLEPQSFPDAPNQPQFPDAILQPGQQYHHQLEFRFSTVVD
ncbi:galactose-1-epimerase [Neptunicella marina]|uniref:Aldose 1-epimerase n=1 Tax=Neptunicella marina TaxID=2125989 RepID=A0A8J6IWM3_9ALTE|nr:galactose mutarotase [Neptunicella marina]